MRHVLSPFEELSRLYVSDITDPQTRRAPEAASVVRRVTVQLLGAMLLDASPQDAQERIRALPFVQPTKTGCTSTTQCVR